MPRRDESPAVAAAAMTEMQDKGERLNGSETRMVEGSDDDAKHWDLHGVRGDIPSAFGYDVEGDVESRGFGALVEEEREEGGSVC